MNQPYQAPGNDPDPQPQSYQPAIFQSAGRLGRVRYFVYLVAVSMVVYGFFGLLMLVGNIGISSTHHSLLALIGVFLGGIASLIVVVMSVILGVRRLNDINASGWLILLALIPLANFVLGLVLLFVPGSTGVNQYGPPAAPNNSGLMVGLFILILMLLGWAGLFGGFYFTTFHTTLERGASMPMHHQQQAPGQAL